MERALQIADRQDGVAALAQLRAAGLSRDQIRAAVRAGRYRPLFRGVYAIGHRALRAEGWWRAALLAVGPGAVLSHQTAAMARGVLPLPFARPTRPDGRPSLPLHVTVCRHLAPQPGLVVHQARVLDRRDFNDHDGLLTTTVERTLIDLADVLGYRELREVADAVKRLNVTWLRRCHDRLPGRRGAGSVDRLLRSAEGGVTRSVFERRLGRFLAEGGLPQPDRRNVNIGGIGWVDAVLDGPRIVLELDSRAWHSREAERRADRQRDRRLSALGYAMFRIVWEDMEPEWAGETHRDLRALIVTRG